MKTILAILAVLVTAGAFAMTPDDKNALAAAEKSLAAHTAAPYPQAAFWSLAVRSILTGAEPVSFAAMVERIDAAAAQISFKSDADRTRQYNSAVVTAALWRFSGKFIPEGYAFAQERGIHEPYFAVHAKRLGMSEADELAGYVELFSRASRADLWIFKNKSSRFGALLNTIPEAEAKEILKKLNRAYSPRLVEDEEAFKPVVTMIRTMLETY